MRPCHVPAARPDHAKACVLFALVLLGFPLSTLGSNLASGAHVQARNEAQLEILYPFDEMTVFDGDGDLDVQLLASPPVKNSPDERIEVFLDGQRVHYRDGKGFVLTKLGRGPHRLRARIVDAHGHAVLHADPVRFYFWQVSALAPPP
ncbi:MAG TPA: hypothetical protein VJ698_03430 [Noviherbaspirillum sp.]|uniref:hypothetical protein n=1 Tax=Noviherbaspirillum sp. TaxID=1926288 RepID=UPI002B4781D1|nr:hypothetical protein [Noviherbaspirillum sp.]HJV84502.1 hypothetical protein [Noviherbaspirillum sp.]